MVDPEAQARFGRYQVLRRVGSGGMGSVFEALDTSSGRHVALKVLHPHIARRRTAIERFVREGHAASRIRHPHVVEIIDLGVEEETPYLAMEFLEGDDLARVIAREGRLAVGVALDVVLPVVMAVAAAHDAGVIHRDLKPSNVCITRGPGDRPWPKVVDFGVSKVIDGTDGDDTGTATDGVVGTVSYMAPEQARSASNASFGSDQYSLGALLYECITGELPFRGRGVYDVVQSVMSRPLAAPSERSAGIPGALDEIVLRAMSRNPEDRFPSVHSFGAALQALASEQRVLSSDPPPRSLFTPLSRYRAPGELLEGEVATFDGVAAVVRGDTMAMLWKTPARVAHTRWVYDIIDRLAARQPNGIRVLMILLPTANAPDLETRMENARRLGRVLPSLRRVSTVIIGAGVFRVLLRRAVRAMMLAHLGLGSKLLSIESTIEDGITRLRTPAGADTPSFEAVRDDACAMFAALGLDAPRIGEPARIVPENGTVT